jgi:hypothetical protein
MVLLVVDGGPHALLSANDTLRFLRWIKGEWALREANVALLLES